jgi:hypothetical protein
LARIYYVYLLFLFLNSVGIFHIVYRINRGQMAWLAYAVAATYLSYIPYALDWVRPLHIGPDSWIVFLMILSAVLMLEFLFRTDRLRYAFLLGSAVLGYFSIRTFEGLIAPVMALPVLLLAFDPRLSKERVIGLATWEVVATIAMLQFAVPYVRGDEQYAYQAGLRGLEDVSISQLASNTFEFYEKAYPLEGSILTTQFDFVAPAILITLIFLAGGALLWMAYPDDRRLPSPLNLMVMFGVGFVLVGLSGAAAIYADLQLLPRSHLTGVTLGHAFGISALLVGLVALGQYLLRVKLSLLLVLVGTASIFTASQWYLKAQIRADAHGLDLTVNNDLWQDMKALIPETEPDTLILYYCPEPTTPDQFIRSTNLPASLLFYDQERTRVAFWHFDVGLVIDEPELTIGQQSITYEALGYTDRPTFEHIEYGYDQVIVVTCQPTGLTILREFPEEIAPPTAQFDRYNPYARIQDTFLTGADAVMLAR